MQLFQAIISQISPLHSSPLTLVVPDEASHDGSGHEEAGGGDSGAIKRGHRSLSLYGRRRFWKGKKETRDL